MSIGVLIVVEEILASKRVGFRDIENLVGVVTRQWHSPREGGLGGGEEEEDKCNGRGSGGSRISFEPLPLLS